MKLLDCTLRDGGYYNSWCFPEDVVTQYLEAMQAARVDVVELGLRSLLNDGFKGANAFTSDEYIRSLNVPSDLKVAVMINAKELLGDEGVESTLEMLFRQGPEPSPVNVVRVACHVHEFARALEAATWLTKRGFEVAFNLMQVSSRSQNEIEELAKLASGYPVDVLYFADSMGSMNPERTKEIIGWIRTSWHGAIGIHTHDNMGLALSNSLRAIECGATWLDATVTGMGRGPGNARTEELVIETSEMLARKPNLVPLMALIRSFFNPLKHKCGWGTNSYYYLSGKYEIHPTYVQEMLGDPRYSEEDIFGVIQHLRSSGGSQYDSNTLDTARSLYSGDATGTWEPASTLEGKEVLLLGAGPSLVIHRDAVERFIRKRSPIVFAMNTQSPIEQELIDVRVACHPVRLLADCEAYASLPQPLIAPLSKLPADISASLSRQKILDFGLSIERDAFQFHASGAHTPNSLVFGYALSIAASGKAKRIFLVGFDGFGHGDSRTIEMDKIIKLYREASSIEMTALTPSLYDVPMKSIYAI